MPIKPTDNEQEFFAKLEFEKKQKRAQEQQAKMAEEEKRRLQELHYMHCPKCGMELTTVDYRGIEVDKCSGCEGVWLDAGELESVSELDQPKLTNWFANFMR